MSRTSGPMAASAGTAEMRRLSLAFPETRAHSETGLPDCGWMGKIVPFMRGCLARAKELGPRSEFCRAGTAGRLAPQGWSARGANPAALRE